MTVIILVFLFFFSFEQVITLEYFFVCFCCKLKKKCCFALCTYLPTKVVIFMTF